MNSLKTRKGAVLLAHGSQDPEAESEAWMLCQSMVKTAGEWDCVPAYLNREPPLAKAVEQLYGLGCNWIEIVPLFVFRGKHVRDDIPALVAEERLRFPGLHIGLQPHLTQLAGFHAFLKQALQAANPKEL